MSIDQTGFRKETLAEIIVRISSQFKEAYPNINLTQGNIIYQWIKVVSIEIYNLQTLIQDLIANMTPLGAAGSYLDYHALNAGISRKGSQQALGTLELTNNTELGKYIISSGSTFSTPTGKEYLTLDDVNFDDNIPITHSTGGSGSIDYINTKYFDFYVDSSLHGDDVSASGNSSGDSDFVVTNTLDPAPDTTGTIYVTHDSGITWDSYAYSSYDSGTKTFTLDGVTLDQTYDTDDVMFYTSSSGSYYYSSILDANDNPILGFYSIDKDNNKLTWKTAQSPALDDNQRYYLQIKLPLTIQVAIVAVDTGSEGNTGENTITINRNSIEGVDTVNNYVALENGLDEETDTDLRARILEADNAKTTLNDIKTMIKNITGVRHAKATNNESDDKAFPSDWTKIPTTSETSITVQAGKILQIAYRLQKDGVSTISGIQLRVKDVGNAPPLYAYLANHTENYFSCPEVPHLDDANINRGIMVKDGTGTWQVITIPVEHNELFSSNSYTLNVYCPEGDGSNNWLVQIMEEDGDEGGTGADNENQYWYNMHREWNLIGDGMLTVVTATEGSTTLTTSDHTETTTTGYLSIDGDNYSFSACDDTADTFTLDDPLSRTYDAGDEVYVYTVDDTNLDTAGKAVIFRTLFTNPSFTVSVIPEDGYDFEVDLQADIINMLNWEEGEGYAPMCINFSVEEATKLYMRITSGDISIEENYTLSDVKSEILNNINDYLDGIEPGTDIVYSQIEKIVLNTDGVWRLRNMTIELTRGSDTFTSTVSNEVDIVVYDDEYVEATEVILTEG